MQTTPHISFKPARIPVIFAALLNPISHAKGVVLHPENPRPASTVTTIYLIRTSLLSLNPSSITLLHLALQWLPNVPSSSSSPALPTVPLRTAT
jgi:hypothetical protein